MIRKFIHEFARDPYEPERYVVLADYPEVRLPSDLNKLSHEEAFAMGFSQGRSFQEHVDQISCPLFVVEFDEEESE